MAAKVTRALVRPHGWGDLEPSSGLDVGHDEVGEGFMQGVMIDTRRAASSWRPSMTRPISESDVYDPLVFFAAVFLGVVLLVTGFFVAPAGCLAERFLAAF